MHLQRVLLVVLAAMMTLTSQMVANPIDLQQAQRIAEEFFKAQGDMLRSSQIPQLSLSAMAVRNDAATLELVAGKELQLREATLNEGEYYYYIFNRGTKDGYVIVSGDDNFEPVLGYSLEGTFNLDEAPSYIQGFFAKVNLALENSLESGDLAVRRDMLPKEASQLRAGLPDQVSPLLGNIKWDQSYPWNSQTPVIQGQNTPVGCVATALAQIMRFHQWPDKGEGSHSYFDGNGCGKNLSANFAQAEYDFSKMPENFDDRNPTEEEVQEVGEFCSHIGIACNMQYGLNGSGAYTTDAAKAMRNYFRYDKALMTILRDFYSANEWLEIVFAELANGYPVFYAGSSEGGGHAFVFDGYDTKGYVHVNWGWGGMSDGYFNISILNPDALGIGGGTGGGFNEYQECIIGLKPDRNGTSKPSEAPLLYNYFSASVNSTAKTVTLKQLKIFTWDQVYQNGKVAIAIDPIEGEETFTMKISSTAVKENVSGNAPMQLMEITQLEATDWTDLKDGTYIVYPVYLANVGTENEKWMPIRFYNLGQSGGFLHNVFKVSDNGEKWEIVKDYDQMRRTSISFRTNKAVGESFLFQGKGFGKAIQTGLDSSPNLDDQEHSVKLTKDFVTIEGFFTQLSIQNAGITDFYISEGNRIQKLVLKNNAINSINVSDLKTLDSLNLSFNNIKELILETNEELKFVNIAGNPIGGEAMGTLLSSLPARTSPKGRIVIQDLGDDPRGTMAYAYKGDVQYANQRGWQVVSFDPKNEQYPYKTYKGVETAVEEISIEGPSVYPLPAQSELFVRGIESGEILRLYTLNGQMVKEATSSGDVTTIVVEDLPAGNYILTCENLKMKVVISR